MFIRVCGCVVGLFCYVFCFYCVIMLFVCIYVVRICNFVFLFLLF